MPLGEGVSYLDDILSNAGHLGLAQAASLDLGSNVGDSEAEISKGAGMVGEVVVAVDVWSTLELAAGLKKGWRDATMLANTSVELDFCISTVKSLAT